MAFGFGYKVLKRLCVQQDLMEWQRAKLSEALFKPYELEMFHWVQDHLKMHHTLPKLETLLANFAVAEGVEVPEPASYYTHLLENQYFHDLIDSANQSSQKVLKANPDDHDKALDIMKGVIEEITRQKYRLRILDVGKEAPELVVSTYFSSLENIASFGWPYLDLQSGGIFPGDVVSVVGRPSLGKTWLTLYTALKNWKGKINVLFVSMEMMILPISQRIASLYTHSNISQLKAGAAKGFATDTYKKFATSIKCMPMEQAKFYVVDGNLAACVEDIFVLADMLECGLVVIDGAYLLRHKNSKLDRFTRAAENTELIKRHCSDTNTSAFCSWQFNRVASQKQKKGNNEEAGLEDIGYTDAIGQISSIVLGLFQEDGVETMKKRTIRVMKGRDGQIGQFSIGWDFQVMDFDQVDPPVEGVVSNTNKSLQWL